MVRDPQVEAVQDPGDGRLAAPSDRQFVLPHDDVFVRGYGGATESSPARAIKSGKTPTMAIRDPFIFCARVSDDSLWYLVYGTNVNQPRRGPKTGIRQQGHFDLDLLAKSSSDAPSAEAPL